MPADLDPPAEPASDSPTAAPHPEEMKAVLELRVGNSISATATARATPAGLMAAALLVSAILIPTLWFAKRKRA